MRARASSPISTQPKSGGLWLYAVVLAGLVPLFFGRIAQHEFLWWDDTDTIALNPDFNPVTLKKVLATWTHAPKETYYYNPVTYTVWGMLAVVAQDSTARGPGLNASVYHLASVGVHAMTVVLVLLLLNRLTNGNRLGAAAGAALFALHPVQVEAVAWASGMKDLLCGLLGVAALWQYAAMCQESAAGAGRPAIVKHYAAATAALVLALLSKPAAVAVPLLAIAIAVIIYRRAFRRIVLEMGPWLIFAAASALYAAQFVHAMTIPRQPPWARLLVAGDAIAFYLWKLICPMWLAPDYGRRPAVVLSHWPAYIIWLIPAILTLLAIFWWRRAPLLATAWAIFIAALLPVLGLVPFDFQYYSTVADHYLYIPMLGAAIALAAVVQRHGQPVLLRITAMVLVALGIASCIQAGYWQNDEMIWSRAVQVNRHSFAGYTSLADALLRNGMLPEAQQAYQKALSINPDHPQAHNIWICHARRGDLDSAIATIDAYLAAWEKLKTRGNSGQLHQMLGQMLLDKGRLDEGLQHLLKAQSIEPHLPQLQDNLRLARSMAAARPPATQPR